MLKQLSVNQKKRWFLKHHSLGDLGADSFGYCGIGHGLEDQFETEIPDEDAQKILTVKDAMEYIATSVGSVEES